MPLTAENAPTEPPGGQNAPVGLSEALEDWVSRVSDGAEFILDGPDQIPALWGVDDEILWAKGEAMMICGPPGAGKTTLAGQLVRCRLGIDDNVLGYHLECGNRRVLYLAADRPAQTRRSLERQFCEDDRDVLRDKLRVWPGPPPEDFAKSPETLRQMADAFDADTVVIDSLKDVALGLSDDESGAGYNRARQIALVHGIELIELHHQVKRGANGGKPTSLADVYGSTWLTSGAGTVHLLFGDPGDPVVQYTNLKPSMATVGPFSVVHDESGRSRVYQQVDLVRLASATSHGITAADAAKAIDESSHKPKASDVEKARRRLEKLVETGQLARIDGAPVRYTQMFRPTA